MRLIITTGLALERQEIEIGEGASIELRLDEHTSLHLHPKPATTNWHNVAVHAQCGAWGHVLLQPLTSDAIAFVLPKER